MSIPGPKEPIVSDIDDFSDEERNDDSISNEEGNIDGDDNRVRLAQELNNLTEHTGIDTTRVQKALFDDEVDLRQSVADATIEAASIRFAWANKRLQACEEKVAILFSHHSYLNKDEGFLGLNIRQILNEARLLQQRVESSNEYDKQLLQRYCKQIDILEMSIKSTSNLLGLGTMLVKTFAEKTIKHKIEGDEEEKTKKIDDFATGLTSLFYHIVSFAYNSKTQTK